MTLQEVMQFQRFAVVGDTLRSEKFAARIKAGLLEQGYDAVGVGKELPSLNDVEGDLEVIDLCINPVKGLALMKECQKSFRAIVIQPGAESAELLAYLNEKNYPYLESCVLIGLREYGKNRK